MFFLLANFIELSGNAKLYHCYFWCTDYGCFATTFQHQLWCSHHFWTRVQGNYVEEIMLI